MKPSTLITTIGLLATSTAAAPTLQQSKAPSNSAATGEQGNRPVHIWRGIGSIPKGSNSISKRVSKNIPAAKKKSSTTIVRRGSQYDYDDDAESEPEDQSIGDEILHFLGGDGDVHAPWEKVSRDLGEPVTKRSGLGEQFDEFMWSYDKTDVDVGVARAEFLGLKELHPDWNEDDFANSGPVARKYDAFLASHESELSQKFEELRGEHPDWTADDFANSGPLKRGEEDSASIIIKRSELGEELWEFLNAHPEYKGLSEEEQKAKFWGLKALHPDWTEDDFANSGTEER